MKVALVDYGAGNLRSAAKALETVGRDCDSRFEVKVTADPALLLAADRIVLPGDGAFADCRAGLAAVDGLSEALIEAVRLKGRPFLGICVGLQLLATRGVERGGAKGLDWVPGEVVPLEPEDPALKVPHMGWNTLELRRPHPLLNGIALGPSGLHAYFLHGFHLKAENDADVIATADHGGPVTAIVARDNVAGTQFHPEKSQRLGLALLGNFLRWKP